MESEMVDAELEQLEQEKAQILKELRELDDSETDEWTPQEARKRFNQLLLECEQFVRDQKGFAINIEPPIQIARYKAGDVIPPSALSLAKPKGLALDFTVPVKVKSYYEVVKNPIFLNQIRDKCKGGKYFTHTEYLDDMRLLLENTRAFNTDPESDWIVQHAQLLMEAAEEAVEARKSDLLYLEQYLEKPEKEVASVKEQDSQAAPLRSGKAAFAKLPKDTYIELYWPPDDQWYTGKVVDYSEEDKMHNIYYEADHSSEWVDLSEVKWKYATVERSAEKRSRTKTHGSTPRFHNNSNNIGYSAESKTTKRRKVEETPKKLSTPILTGGTVSSRKVAEDGLEK
ncbi:TATA-box binding protein-associated factor 1 [Galdieria sulphuraria]|uniref:TATA-box binding protein-associated factor 1 n=1 Tax=Galdieria sulphuraria TaxID=130081 RepID=M2XNB4_GALSU|nr:TATA-box binding protein-associated factor 1 [Galdieria sulphuraria]EME31682.1 TATA-box binding protein-associated factor 1 [Galdieria sulphuraria]|eukprot:XP_005708202.1 TATA-box binding protein-associated factor 1 [Galdieria sulphuraria]